MNVILYTIDCPRCKVLEKKLNQAMIEYETFTDKNKMIEMGMSAMPILEVDGQRMNFKEANEWVNERS